MTDRAYRPGDKVITKTGEWATVYSVQDHVDGVALPLDKITYTIRLNKLDSYGRVVLRMSVLGNQIQERR